MKRTWLWISSTLLILVVAAGLLWYFMRPQASETSCNSVMVYTGSNYSGVSACLASGDYLAPALVAKGIKDNSISSIRVYPGFKVTLYQDNNYGGYSGAIFASVADLSSMPILTSGRFNWDSQISSIKVVGVTPPVATTCTGVIVYKNINFYGTGTCLEPGDYSADALKTKGISNNTIASIQVPTGHFATIYQDDNFSYSNDSMVITTDKLVLVKPVEDSLSSIRISGDCQGVAVFSDANFTGNEGYGICLPVGDYPAAALTAKGISQDSMGSIKINPGFKATVYENGNFDGNIHDFTGNVANLATIPLWNGSDRDWHDKISSIKVMKLDTPVTELTLTVNPNTISTGGSATLTWANANSACNATPAGWFDTTKVAGTAIVKPTADTIYKLVCGAVTKQAEVKISSCAKLSADLNNDCFVNVADFVIMNDQWTDSR